MFVRVPCWSESRPRIERGDVSCNTERYHGIHSNVKFLTTMPAAYYDALVGSR